MDTKELKAAYGRLRASVEAAATEFDRLGKVAAGVRGEGPVGVIRYEGARKLEEFMHRVGDVMNVLVAVTPENVEKMAGQAAARAGLRIAQDE